MLKPTKTTKSCLFVVIVVVVMVGGRGERVGNGGVAVNAEWRS